MRVIPDIRIGNFLDFGNYLIEMRKHCSPNPPVADKKNKDVELVITKIFSTPGLPEINPTFRDSGLDKFVKFDPQFENDKGQEELKKYFTKYLGKPLLKSYATQELIGKNVIWCHKVILDKTFKYLEHNTKHYPKDIFMLLFEVLYLFSSKTKML